MMLVLAPESMIMLSLQPSTFTPIFSSFFSPTVKAYTGSSSSWWQPTIFAALPLGSCGLWFAFAFLHLSALSSMLLKISFQPTSMTGLTSAGQLESRPKRSVLPHR